MPRPIHPNTKWLRPSEAARLSGYNRHSFKRWAKEGIIRAKPDTRRKKKREDEDAPWLYYRPDIEQNIMRII